MRNKPRNTIDKILLSGIGSFLLVIFFPQGARYFFKNIFAGLISSLVTIILAGLLTEKLVEQVVRKDQPLNRRTSDAEA